ncbi:MAG TPA: response regulator [Terriglobales bacterium]|nr:response regulator [Terriglobales bacterium]
MNVLIAEDDPFFRAILQQLLCADYEVQTVSEGESAWRLLQQRESPGIVILDWIMPGLTGPQLCRYIRNDKKTAGNYVVLLTARNSASDIIAGLEAGADDYVTKPFEAEELRARVRLGRRLLDLQAALLAKSQALEESSLREKLLQSRLKTESVLTTTQAVSRFVR